MAKRQDAQREKLAEERAQQSRSDESTTKALEAPGSESEADTDLFDSIARRTVADERQRAVKGVKFKEHKYTTGKHKMSPRKLKLLATQISGLPVDEAILQMQFSNKAAATWLKSSLALARDHAVWYKNATREKLVVCESLSKCIFKHTLSHQPRQS